MRSLKIKTKDGEVELNSFQLADLLTNKIHTQKSPDLFGTEVSSGLNQILLQGEVLHRTSLEELGYLHFLAGYHYRVFLEKNDVQFSSTNETTVEDPSNSAASPSRDSIDPN